MGCYPQSQRNPLCLLYMLIISLHFVKECCFLFLKNTIANTNTFHFSKTVFSFSKCVSECAFIFKMWFFFKCAFIFKMWKVFWVLFFLFLKNTFVNKNLYILLGMHHTAPRWWCGRLWYWRIAGKILGVQLSPQGPFEYSRSS